MFCSCHGAVCGVEWGVPMKKRGEQGGSRKPQQVSIRSGAAEYLTYVSSLGESAVQVEMRYEDENIWLTQRLMALLYDVDVRTINYHVKKILKDSELQEDGVIRKIWIPAEDGKTYGVLHY